MNKTKKLCIIVLCVFIIYIIFMFFDISVQEGMSSDEYITQLTEQVEKSAYEKLSNHPNVNKEEALKLVREVAEAVFRSKENGYGGRAEAQSPTDRGVSREIREISIIIAMSTASIVADKALDEYIETAEYEDSKVYANDISTGIWEEEIIKQENKIKTEKQRIIQGESIPIDLTDIGFAMISPLSNLTLQDPFDISEISPAKVLFSPMNSATNELTGSSYNLSGLESC